MTGRRPLRASTYALALILLATASGALYLWRGAGSKIVYEAAIDLPPLHQITEADVRAAQMRASDVPAGAITVRSNLLGRYTLVSVAQDSPFLRDGLGPGLPPGTIASRRLTGLGVSVADVNGVASRGDEVDILVPSRDGGNDGVVLRGAIILDMKDSAPPGRRTLLVAIVASDEAAMMRVTSESRILIVRRPIQSLG